MNVRGFGFLGSGILVCSGVFGCFRVFSGMGYLKSALKFGRFMAGVTGQMAGFFWVVGG